MSVNRDREEEIFDAARELASHERAAYLAERCGQDADLRQRIEGMLAADAAAGEFFKTHDASSSTAILSDASLSPSIEKAGDRIGRYKLLQQIGEGGCGIVYMAEQEEPVRRRVALKVIKLGMDTKQVIARFEAERQALALMDHPNIAKIHDAGITEGRARHSVRAGVEASESGAPGTDAPYLSPGRPYFVMELVRGIKITEFCDENKLSTADRLKLFIQVCQAIQHAHQKGVIHRDIKPSNILVTINDGLPVPKVIDFGIAKATAGRLTDQTLFTAFEQFIGTPAYMSPEQAVMTSLDIDTRSDIYSLGVLLYELLTGKTPFDQKELLAAGLDEMRRTIRETEPPKPSTRLGTMAADALTTTAKHHHTDAPKLIHLLRGDLDWIVMKSLDKDRTRRYETANGLASDIQRHLSNEPVVACPPSNLYRFQKLVRRNKLAFAAAAAIAAVLVLGVVVSTWQAVRATRAEREQSRLLEAAQKAQATEAALRLRAQADEKKAETEAARSKQVAQFMKDMLQGVGPAVALGRDTKLLREILDQTAKRLNDLKGQPVVEADLRATLGRVYYDLGELKNATRMHREALELRKILFGNEHLQVANSLNELAVVLCGQRKYPEAEAVNREALAMRRKLLGVEHPDTAQSLFMLAWSLREQGKLVEAEVLYQEALAMQRKLLGNEHSDVLDSLSHLAATYIRQNRLTEAEATFRQALAVRDKLNLRYQPSMAFTERSLGDVLLRLGKLAEAEAILAEALTMRRTLLGDDHPKIADALAPLTHVLLREGKFVEAEPLARQWMTISEKLSPADWSTFDARMALGDSLLGQKKFAEAEPLLLAGYEGMKQRQAEMAGGNVRLIEALQRLVRLYEARGERDQAALWRQKLTEFDHPTSTNSK